jgi:hypothetical protein
MLRSELLAPFSLAICKKLASFLGLASWLPSQRQVSLLTNCTFTACISPKKQLATLIPENILVNYFHIYLRHNKQIFGNQIFACKWTLKAKNI